MIAFFIISISLSLFYFGFIFSIYLGLKKISRKTETSAEEFPTVTVLIPFRNEEENLVRSIESINKLDFPHDKIEVFYINDNSTDSSLYVFKSASKKEFISLIEVEKSEIKSAGKKNAILTGINNSKNEIIITTDADCYFGKDWLKNLVYNFDNETALTAGAVDLTVKENFLGKFQRIEFSGLNLTSAGLISIGKPIICSAANLAYRRSVFNEVEGFGKTIKFSSGDDDFLLQKIASLKKYKIKFAYNKKAMVFTEGKETLSEFFNQRARWASKGFGYENYSTVIFLILIFLFYLMIPLQLLLIVFFDLLFVIPFGFAILLKLIPEYLVMNKGLNDLYDKKLMKYFFVSELFQIPYIILSPLIGIFGKFNWKGRDLKK